LTDPRKKSLPGGIRFAAMLGMVFAAFTGWNALVEASRMVHLFESRSRDLEQGAAVAAESAELYQRLIETYYAALEPMREPRGVLMALLAVACAFVFVASARMLRPYGLPRDGMRRILGRAAILAAVLRTVDGAQFAVVARRMGDTMAESLNLLPNVPPELTLEFARSFFPSVGTGGAVLATALVAGTFAILGQYFRSERVREAVAVRDGPQPE